METKIELRATPNTIIFPAAGGVVSVAISAPPDTQWKVEKRKRRSKKVVD